MNKVKDLPTEKPLGPTSHVTETKPPWSELVAGLTAVYREIEAMQRPNRKGEGQQLDYGAGTSVSTPSVADERPPGDAQTLVDNLDKNRRGIPSREMVDLYLHPSDDFQRTSVLARIARGATRARVAMAATETLCRVSRVSVKKAPKAQPTGKLRRRDPVAITQNASRKQAGTDPSARRADMFPTLGAGTTRRAEGTEGAPRRRTCATPTKLRRRDVMATLTVPALGTVASDATHLTILATTDVEEEST